MPSLDWIKATHSVPSGDCVELAALGNGKIGLRNSRYPTAPCPVFTVAEIRAFLAGAKAGEFDHLVSG